MKLNHEIITSEEIEEFMEREAILKQEKEEFHQAIFEWLYLERVLYNSHDGVIEKEFREEAYFYNMNIAFECFTER